MGIVDRLLRAAGGLIGEGAAAGADGAIVFGPQVCGSLEEASAREWLVADGCGGYAMGTVSGLRTRRYHGLLVASGRSVGQRRLGLASLDATLVVGDRRYELATNEWSDGTVRPAGHRLLAAFALDAGVPRWQWRIGGVVVEREVASVHGRPAVAVVHRVVAAPGPVQLEVTALCADRDAHGAQQAHTAGLGQEPADRGCVVAGWYRLLGPGFEPTGRWHRAARLREEEARGEAGAVEDLWEAGRFRADLAAGETLSVLAWAGELDTPPPAGEELVRAARSRWRATTAGAVDETDALLLAAADQFVVDARQGPAVVAGYPWFGEWGRDTFVCLEGLLLTTGRAPEARSLLRRWASGLSDGMVPNTTDSGDAAHNTVDGTLWFVHAAGVYVATTGDTDLAAELAPLLDDVVQCHLDGTRYGIRVDHDGLLTQGAEGVALTWMDAVTDGHCHTPRRGKAVEVQALWVNALGAIRVVNDAVSRDPDRWGLLEEHARIAFGEQFAGAHHLADVVGGPDGTDSRLRPNLLLAASLPHGPGLPQSSVAACRDALLTPLGLRTLALHEPGYRGSHRGTRHQRDAAYHQGTVWPWLLGPFVDACVATSVPCPAVLDGVEAHLGEVGLGSVSETADGDAPHGATGCPFQAWSVAEVLRVRRRWADRLRP